MKIGIFTNNYKPIISGLTESVESFREGLEKRGHKVYIFAPNFPGYKDENPNVFRFPSIDFKYKTQFPIAITWDRGIFKKAKDLDLDIIHCQHPFNAGAAGLKFAKKLGVPAVFTNHTRYDIYTHFIPFLSQSFLKWYVKNTAANFANNCDMVIAPSESIKEIICEWGVKSPIEIIPTGVRMEQFKSANGRMVREKFGITDKDFLLLTVARLALEKNVEFLVNVFAKISGNKGNLKFMIVGDGSDRARLEEIVRKKKIFDRVIFAGAVAHSEIGDYFKAGDIFMYASLSETQGIMTVEAMASGIPVIAVKAQGAQDIITSGEDGILTANDEGEFAAELGKIIKDSDLRKKISEKALKTAQEYSIENCAEKMAGVYESLIKNKK
ncbi:MAG: glycosyltransferase family 4 protein [bacterium]